MVSLRTIFAIIPSAQTVQTVIKAFKELPLDNRARMVGVHVSPTPVAYGLISDIALNTLIAAQIEAAETERISSEQAFAEACQREGVSYEWRANKASDYLIGPQAGSLARAADLVIHPELRPEYAAGLPRVEEVVLAAGRPVLVIPSNWNARPIGRRVIVAWDGGREAARAVFDAFPILLKSKTVRIVSVEGYLDEPIRQFTPGDDIAATLSRHGIPAESHAFRGRAGSVRAELETQALDTDADLIVMGCYGHSRFREMILGGVSRSMLKSAPYPLLLSN